MISYQKKLDIRYYIRYHIIDEIRTLYRDSEIEEVKEYSVFDNIIKAQWFFDETLNSIFIWYELDKYARNFLPDWETLYIKINARLTNNMMEYYDMNCNIISPANNIYMDKSKDEKVHSANAELKMIRPTTYTCWKCNGSWEFIEYDQRHELDFHNCVHTKEYLEGYTHFIEELKTLNNKYNNDFSSKNPYDDTNLILTGFNEFIPIYEKWCGTTLTPVDMSKVEELYLSIAYNEKER